jgi:site-specific DNA-cytosine methylase
MPSLYLLELFSGTGSVGAAVRDMYGGDLLKHYSVDIHTKYNPTTAIDMLQWNYKPDLDAFLEQRTKDDYVIVWMSPPCTQYSIARSRAKTPRDLEGADALVERALEIKDYVNPNAWFLENPHGASHSALRLRPIMQPLEQYRNECTYCHYGKQFRKRTDIWTNVPVELRRCTKSDPCPHVANTKRHKHPVTAQSGPSAGARGCGSAEAAYPIPPRLVEYLFGQAFEDSPLPPS